MKNICLYVGCCIALALIGLGYLAPGQARGILLILAGLIAIGAPQLVFWLEAKR